MNCSAGRRDRRCPALGPAACNGFLPGGGELNNQGLPEFGVMLEKGCFAINLQLFGAYPHRDEKRLECPYDPPGWLPEGRDGLLAEPWQHDRGMLELPTGPGLGFEIDEKELRRHGRHLYTATAPRVALRTIRDRGLGLARTLGKTRSQRLESRNREFEELLASGKSAVELAIAPNR